jgi:hypothetical protein
MRGKNMSLKRIVTERRKCPDCLQFKVCISGRKAFCAVDRWPGNKKEIKLTTHQDLFIERIPQTNGGTTEEVISVNIVHRKTFDCAVSCPEYNDNPCPINNLPFVKYARRKGVKKWDTLSPS